MKREFLEGLSLNREITDRIMSEHGKSIEKFKSEAAALNTEIEGIKAEKNELAEKYENDMSVWQEEKNQIAYESILSEQLECTKFTSKLAKQGIISRLKEMNIEVTEGKLQGFNEKLDLLKQEEPDAFAVGEQKKRTVAMLDFGGKIEGDEAGDDFIANFRAAAGLKE